MIADQTPNKLIPEVLKNTNTKIVHKLFAADDKKAIANTMALEEEQAEFLSKLNTGSAIVFSGGFNKAVAVQMKQLSNTTSNEFISEEIIQENIYDFYAQNYKDGVILGSHLLENADSKVIRNLLNLQRRGIMEAIKTNWKQKQKVAPKLLQSLEDISKDFEFGFLVQYFMLENGIKEDKISFAQEFLDKYLKNKMESEDVGYFKDNLF